MYAPVPGPYENNHACMFYTYKIEHDDEPTKARISSQLFSLIFTRVHSSSNLRSSNSHPLNRSDLCLDHVA